MGKHILPFIILTIFSVLGMKAIFHPDLFSAHDIWHQVARLYHYYKAVGDGQFPPYWIGNLANGYGYPLFFFSYHLPWILGLPFLGLGISIPETLKILFVSSYILSGIFMYLFVEGIFKNKMSALLSAIIYLWAPYRFLTILVEASMGTAFVFTFLPILLLGIYKSCNDKKPNKGIILTAIGLSGIMLSHFLSFIAVIPLSILFALWSLTLNSILPALKGGVSPPRENVVSASIHPRAKARGFLEASNKRFIPIKFKNLLFGLCLGLGISGFYLLPAVYYSKFTQVATGAFSALYQNSFVNLSQITYSKWGYGLNKISAKEGQVPYQLGIAQWLSFATAMVFLVSGSLRNLAIPIGKKIKKLTIVIIGVFSLSIFFTLDVSRPPWDILSNIIVLDSPTIFLLPATFASAFLSGIVFISIRKPINILFFIFIVSLALYANRNHLRVNTYTNIPVGLYIASEITTNSFHEYLPKTADIKIFTEENRVILPKDIKIINFVQNTVLSSTSALFTEEKEAVIRHLSFPGINLYLDGRKKEINTDQLGRIKLTIPKGIHSISVKFEETPLIKVSKLITIASIFGLFLLIKRVYAEKNKT